jgi:mono/diheme cytochrome c family protein
VTPARRPALTDVRRTDATSGRIVALVLGTLAIAPSACPAAAVERNADHRPRGLTVAVELCSRCHVVGREPQVGGRIGPDFTTIAAMPSTTGLALNLFLQSHRQWMPSIRLDRDEMDAVIDYILSLRPERTTTP